MSISQLEVQKRFRSGQHEVVVLLFTEIHLLLGLLSCVISSEFTLVVVTAHSQSLAGAKLARKDRKS